MLLTGTDNEVTLKTISFDYHNEVLDTNNFLYEFIPNFQVIG